MWWMCLIKRALGFVLPPGAAALVCLGCAGEGQPPHGGSEAVASSAAPLVWGQRAKLVANDALAFQFGNAIAFSGDTALVGAHNDYENGTQAGAAYVFVRSGGLWIQQQKLLPGDGAEYDWFGSSVALSGDTALVGATYGRNSSLMNTGAAYVFVRIGGVWTQQQKLLASDGAPSDEFGGSVALFGDTAVVGAQRDNDTGGYAGSAYVFVRSAGVWSQQQKLLASDGMAFDQFGGSVALSGDTALIGLRTHNNSTLPGAAYVFVRSAGVWSQQQKLLASDGMAFDFFGGFVALSGDTALIGANGDDGQSGSAYVFVRSGGSWAEQQKLLPSDPAAGKSFACSVALSGDMALVGAWGDATNGIEAGAAYMFVRSSGVWTQQQKLLESNTTASRFFGQSAALSGDTALVGALDTGPGAVYVFTLALGQGSACTSGTQCDSGFCTDGVCCDTACAGGPCQTCSIAAGASTDGTCEPLTGPVCDDNNPCTQTDTCQAGACVGTNPVVCPGDDCHEGVCLPATGMCTTQQKPDGTLCSDGDACTQTDTCQGGVCSGTNPKVCPNLDPCHLGFCDAATGQCESRFNTADPSCPKVTLGEKCTSAGECDSGFCADGVCCDSACAAPCYSCVRPDLVGTCAIQPQGEDRRGDCSQGQECATTCPGVEGGTCIPVTDATNATNGIQCAPARCVAKSHSLAPALCTGPNEPCPEAKLVDCGDFACDDVTGMCRSKCKTAADCASNRVCGPHGRCVAPPPVASGEGRSCAFAPSAPAGGAPASAFAAVMLAALALARRRASTRRRGRCAELAGFVLLVAAVALGGVGCGPNVPLQASEVTPSAEAMGPVHPLAITSPVWGQRAKLLASDSAAGNQFGISVALSGDTALVGARYLLNNTNPGAAYVFVRSGGVWTEQQKLVASDGTNDDQFGWSVALDGDTALVGAYHDSDAPPFSGSVYVFVRSGGVWTEQQKLIPSSATMNDHFGWSVALSGDTALVGAPGDDGNSQIFSGTAYVFVRNGGVWTEQAILQSSDADGADNFGSSVALSGQTALVGANHNNDAGPYSGSAYVFGLSGTFWIEKQKLLASNGGEGNYFGVSVALSGDTALVGADAVASVGASPGSAYTFVHNGGVWTEQQQLFASNGIAGNYFGDSVALAGDTALVGAPGDDSQTLSGSAYVFVQNGGVWTEQQKLVASDGMAYDTFGSSVALSGETALVGALASPFGPIEPGAAYVFALALSQGSPCSSGIDCDSGFCTGGVCCDSACLGRCEACSIAMGASADGTCTPLTGPSCNDNNPCTQTDTCQAGACVGADPKVCPRDDCNDGVCDAIAGGDGCTKQPKPDGTLCDDKNACTLTDTCQSGMCSGGNATICPDLDACHLGYCHPATGKCGSQLNTGDPSCGKLDLGDKCSIPEECNSGFCADGVCCDSACTQPCHSCVLPQQPGMCGLQDEGEDRRGDCFKGMDCVSTCSGKEPAPGEDPCTEASAGVQCAPAKCVDDTHSVAPAICPGPNQPCPTPELLSCWDYLCDEVYGTCRTECVTAADCAPNRVCDPDRKCVSPPPPTSGGDGACACSVPASRGSPFGALAGLMLALLAVARRTGTFRCGGRVLLAVAVAVVLSGAASSRAI